MFTILATPALLALVLQHGATPMPARPGPATPDILAACWSADAVVRFDGATGAYEGPFTLGGPLRLPAGVDFGPDGNLYVTSFYWDTVLKYHGRTGQYLGTFVPEGAAGLNQPSLIEFRPDGLLYVLSSYDGGVMRFDATTGAFHDTFIPAGSGGITVAFAMTFGPDGDVYLGGYYSKTVVRFDGQTGAVEGVVAQYVDTPSGMAFDEDGNLLVGEWRSGSFSDHNVQRYTPDGEDLGLLTELVDGPLDFLVDGRNRLFIAGRSSIDVRDAATGAWLRSMYHPAVENLMAITFMPQRTRTLR